MSTYTWASPVNPWLENSTNTSGVNQIEDEEQRRALSTLAGLGLISNESAFAVTANEPIKRSEAAELLYAMSGETDAGYADMAKDYDDVGGNAEAVGYVITKKVMLPYSDGSFRSDETLVYNDAVRAVVELMGYRPYALAEGGDETAYYKVGNRYDLIRGLKCQENADTISKIDFVVCMYHLLSADVLKQDRLGEEKVYRIGGSLLEEYFNIMQNKGIVEATAYGSIDGQPERGLEAIYIDGKEYSMKSISAQKQYEFSQLLGYRVLYYYRENELIYLWQDDSISKSIRLTADEIIGLQDNQIEAESDNGKSKKYGIDQLANVIRNGRYTGRKIHTFTYETLLPQTGYVTIIDQDCNGKYDIVIVEDYQNFLVEEVNAQSYRMRNMLNGQVVSWKDGVDQPPLIAKGGQVTSLSSIQAWQAVGLMVSDDGKLLQVRIPDVTSVSGVVTQMSEDEVMIDGAPYKLTFDYGENVEDAAYLSKNIEVGMSGSFILNIEGKVIAVQENTSASHKKTGYLIEAAMGNGFDSDTLQVLIMSQEGELLTLKSNAKLIFNGQKDYPAAAAYQQITVDGKAKQQLVRYRTNGNGVLVMLASSYDPYAEENAGEEPDEDRPQLQSYKTSRIFNTAESKFECTDRSVDPSYREFYIDKDTIVFTIPSTYSGVASAEKQFGVSRMSVFMGESSYTIEGYDIDETYTCPYVVAVVSPGTNISANNDPIGVIRSVTQSINQAGNTTVGFELLYNGAQTLFVCSDTVQAYTWTYSSSDAKIELDVSKHFHKGDVVRIALDENGEIGAIAKHLPKTPDGVMTVPPAAFTSSHGAYNELTFGEVEERNGVNLGVRVIDGNTQPKLIFRLTSATIYVYNVASDQLFIGDVGDIYAKEHYPGDNEASYIMLRAQNNTVYEAVVYNYNQ
ncbi:hypothetical protein [Ructibacterium gallinarum]|nr:hypothetical protein [Ructibacterium gallinarum]